MDTWRELIQEEASKHGDSVDAMTISIEDGGLDREFDDWYGLHEGCPFTAWSVSRVYFPIVYDGAEWVGSAPRNPCDERLEHFGDE